MSTRKPYGLAALLWVGMVILFFWPVLFQNKVIAPLDILESLLRPWATSEKIEVNNAFTYDAISQYLPYDWSVYQSLRQDGYIGWNPYTHSGTAIVENTMLCPGDWHHQLYRFLPFWTAWNLGIILQITLAGIGMLLLLRDQKIPAAYALLGVVAFGFYSQFILWIQHRWILGAMCWAPWIVWSLLRTKKNHPPVNLASIAFIALAFRGGHLQTCVFTVLLVTLIAAHEWHTSPNRWSLRQSLRILAPYAATGLISSLLCIDIFLATVPPFLTGGRELPARGWLDTLLAIPTLITALFPTLLGTPQGMDATKAFKVDLFSIKYAGSITLLLGSIALFNRRAPGVAKILFIVGLLLPFTPADKWLYSRVTVVFAIGLSWLAAWQIHQYSQQPKSKIWKIAAITFSSILFCWLLVSFGMAWKAELILEKLKQLTLSNLDERKPLRTDWMISRTHVFYHQLLIWHPQNLIYIGLITLSLLIASKINQTQKASHLYIIALVCVTLTELITFSKTWITFSLKPPANELFKTPAWITQLKHQAADGRVKVESRGDFDYMQLNTPSAYGIRFSEGYETVTPRRINPDQGRNWDPIEYASVGVSHLLVSPRRNSTVIEGWQKIHESKEYILYSNPHFKGLNNITLQSGETVELKETSYTPNRRSYTLPTEGKSVTILESYNPGWKYSFDKKKWHSVESNQDLSMRVPIPESAPTELHMQYSPQHHAISKSVILATLVTTLALYFRSKRLNLPRA